MRHVTAKHPAKAGALMVFKERTPATKVTMVQESECGVFTLAHLLHPRPHHEHHRGYISLGWGVIDWSYPQQPVTIFDTRPKALEFIEERGGVTRPKRGTTK